jgi:hypothetical protein
MKAKYRFHDLKMRSGPLPLDVNEFVETVAGRFNDASLTKMLSSVREKKLYGEGVYVDDSGRLVAKFEFQKGVCPRFELVEYHGNKAAFFRSVHNDKVEMSKRERNSAE